MQEIKKSLKLKLESSSDYELKNRHILSEKNPLKDLEIRQSTYIF